MSLTFPPEQQLVVEHIAVSLNAAFDAPVRNEWDLGYYSGKLSGMDLDYDYDSYARTFRILTAPKNPRFNSVVLVEVKDGVAETTDLGKEYFEERYS